MTKQLRASTVSAALRRAGYSPSHDRKRQGVRVSGGNASWSPVTVTADLDSPTAAVELSAGLAETLTELGYTVERIHPNSVTVRRQEATA